MRTTSGMLHRHCSRGNAWGVNTWAAKGLSNVLFRGRKWGRTEGLQQRAAMHFDRSSPRSLWPCPLDPSAALSAQGAFPNRQPPTKLRFHFNSTKCPSIFGPRKGHWTTLRPRETRSLHLCSTTRHIYQDLYTPVAGVHQSSRGNHTVKI